MWNLPRQGLNSCLLHWQADSVPLSHHGSPTLLFLDWSSFVSAFPYFSFFQRLCIYLAGSQLQHIGSSSVDRKTLVACRLLSYGMWVQIPRPGIRPHAPYVRSLESSHWTLQGSPSLTFLIGNCLNLPFGLQGWSRTANDAYFLQTGNGGTFVPRRTKKYLYPGGRHRVLFGFKTIWSFTWTAAGLEFNLLECSQSVNFDHLLSVSKMLVLLTSVLLPLSLCLEAFLKVPFTVIYWDFLLGGVEANACV